MGNQSSSASGGEGGGSGGARQMRGFMRQTGVLGLSKAELDERCRPSGLYPSCKWEDKAIRKIIGDGKVAPRLQGSENRSSPTDRECPICFLQYRQVNILKCCSAHICTECYLQVRPQKAKSYHCPFCNHSKMTVTPAQAMNAESMLLREEAEQRVIEAKIRQRAQAEEAAPSSNSSSNNNNNHSGHTTPERKPAASDFGSSLQQNNDRIATLRARSSSLSEHEITESIPEDVLKSSFAMTPEERRSLEDEMRAQHSHPLSLQYEAEAEERRMRNEQEYLRNNPTQYEADLRASRGSSSRRSRGGEPRRNWNQIVEAFERGGHGEVNSLDDLVVLEAAMILSMEEETRRRASGRTSEDNSSSRNIPGESSGDDGGDFDANQHATEGFPLVRSILSGRHSETYAAGDPNAQLQNVASRRRSRNSFLRAAAHGASEGDSSNSNNPMAMDTVGLAMRGISEDDQIAMAIAASMQDQQQPQEEAAQDGDNSAGEGESSGDSSNSNSNSNTESNSDAGDGAAGDASESPPTEVSEEEVFSEASEVNNSEADVHAGEYADAVGGPAPDTSNVSISDYAEAAGRSDGELSATIASESLEQEIHGD